MLLHTEYYQNIGATTIKKISGSEFYGDATYMKYCNYSWVLCTYSEYPVLLLLKERHKRTHIRPQFV